MKTRTTDDYICHIVSDTFASVRLLYRSYLDWYLYEISKVDDKALHEIFKEDITYFENTQNKLSCIINKLTSDFDTIFRYDLYDTKDK